MKWGVKKGRRIEQILGVKFLTVESKFCIYTNFCVPEILYTLYFDVQYALVMSVGCALAALHSYQPLDSCLGCCPGCSLSFLNLG